MSLFLLVNVIINLTGAVGIGGIMVSMFVSSTVDRGFEPQSGQLKEYEIGICCFFANHSALRRKTKDWLAWNKYNVS
jgi:hypothetical protein